MIALDVLYIALATIGIMALLQVLTFIMVRLLYPPEPKIIYRDVPQIQQAPVQAPLFTPTVNYELPILPLVSQVPVLTETKQEVQLPDYDVRKSVSTSARLDSVLPDGIQETRPPGT